VGFVLLRNTAIVSALGLSLVGFGSSWALAAESLPAATDVRVGGDDKQTRFVVDLTPSRSAIPIAW
jgi:hypothetical protein